LMGAGDLAGLILAKTRGHTLFVVETLRSLAEGTADLQAGRVPESLKAAVLTRSQRTGEAVEEMLRAAAILGPAFDLPMVADLLELTLGDVIRRAQGGLRASLIRESGNNYEFANDLIQEVLHEATPAPTRAALHRRAAALLEENPEAAAGHAAAAGDWPDAATAWL